VYTPEYIVQKILDDVGFTGDSITKKKILDPACGDGRFLIEAAKRVIKVSPKERLSENLEYIIGWDIDEEAVESCINNLEVLVAPLGIEVNWQIFVSDAIQELPQKDLFSNREVEKFDFIIGNPPYIRIQHLDIAQRIFVQQNYRFCQNGSTDIYIAFFELALSLLNENGICGFITPNTYIYTEAAKMLRKHFAQSKNLLQITNYAEIQLFRNATTYSAITIFNRKQNRDFLFQKASSQRDFIEKRYCFSELTDSIWQLSTEEKIKKQGKRLGDIAKIHVGITTLCDKAYIFPVSDLDKEYVIAHTKLHGKVKIEKEVLKPVVKASTLKSSFDPIREHILFPYKRENGKHKIISENDFKTQFPLAYSYLLAVKSELDKRDAGKPNGVAWYAFGRSQGLDTSFGRKILFSPMNHRPNFILYENEECTFYSGYCIKYNGDYERLLEQLNSEAMKKFIEISSRDFRGGWKAYNKKVVENFIVEI
jgi:methylase of polypeptide subunit release factors